MTAPRPTKHRMSDTTSRSATRDPWVALGMTVSATSAAISSFSGLHSLALATGWHPWVASLFPLTIDAWAMTATRVWLAGSTRSARARDFARRCAVAAILFSVAGNAVWHLIGAHLLGVGWAVVLAVGAVPPVVLGLVSHLAALRKLVDPAVPQSVPSTVLGAVPGDEVTIRQPGRPKALPQRRRGSGGRQNRPRYGSEDELLAAAQEADAAYRAAHDGKKGITRDELRRSLRISGERATAVLRKLRAEEAEYKEPVNREAHMQ